MLAIPTKRAARGLANSLDQLICCKSKFSTDILFVIIIDDSHM